MGNMSFEGSSVSTDEEYIGVPEVGRVKDEGTIYGDIWKELEKEVEFEETLELTLKLRPSIRLRYRAVISFRQLQTWAKNSTKGKETDNLALMTRVVVATNDGFIMRGKAETDESGNPLSFRHAGFRERINALTPEAAVEHIFGKNNDAEIISHGRQIIEAAGYTTDEDGNYVQDDEADPLDS